MKYYERKISHCTLPFRCSLRWPITATAVTKRKTFNKEILINKAKFCSHIKKDSKRT